MEAGDAEVSNVGCHDWLRAVEAQLRRWLNGSGVMTPQQLMALLTSSIFLLASCS
jgi:hypothetical protein